MNEQIERLQRRVEQLEAARRKGWRRWALTVVLALGAVVLMGQDAKETVRAERFVVEGPTGEARGIFEVEAGIASLRLKDTAGAPRIHLAVDEDDVPSIAFLEADGTSPRAVLGLAGSGSGALALKDSTGTNRLALTVTKTGTPSVALFDAAGETRVSLGVADNGVCFLALKDDAGKIREFLYLLPDGSGHFQIKDAEGEVLKKLP